MKHKSGKLVIGIFYDNLKQAEQRKKSQEKIHKKKFIIIEFPKGWLVIAEAQLESFVKN